MPRLARADEFIPYNPELVENMRKQAQNFGADYLAGNVVDADLSKRPFRLNVEGEPVETLTLIVASRALESLALASGVLARRLTYLPNATWPGSVAWAPGDRKRARRELGLGNAPTLSEPDASGRFWIQAIKYF